MDSAKITINGIEYSVQGSEFGCEVTLLHYIRNVLHLSGTKYMCLAGSCGACSVSVQKSSTGEVQSINSCMVPLLSCHGWQISTIEHLGNRKDGYHIIQKTLAETNGTQCGYCSPGWVQNLYSLLQNGNKPTMLEIEKSFGSNLCRCTGYRPILEAFKKFGSDAPDEIRISDIEDLPICKKTGAICDKTQCDDADSDWCMLSKVEVKSSPSLQIQLKDGKMWYKVNDLNTIFEILRERGYDSYMLVNGNTNKAINSFDEFPNNIIDISFVPELRSYTYDQNLVLGTGFSIHEIETILKNVATQDDFKYLTKFVEHFESIANVTVKNLGSLGGNLVMKNSNNEFASDLYLLLETVGANVTVQSDVETKVLSMSDFLQEDLVGKVIVNVILPPLNSTYYMESYKVMPRAQSAGAIVNAGFLYQIVSNKVKKARIVYGGLSSASIRAEATEAYLEGKLLFSNSTLQGALSVLENELVLTGGLLKASVAYRKQLALSLYYKSVLSVCPDDVINSTYVSGITKIHHTRPVSSATRTFDNNSHMWPLCQPTPKVEALIQCAGEIQYTDDIPTQPREVYAAFVLSTQCVGEIISIDASEALKVPGVLAFYSAADIPGENSFTPGGTPFFAANEEVFAATKVQYYNQPIGIIVGETQHIATVAAKLVTATYQNVRDPVLDLKTAITDSNRVTLYASREQTETGTDVVKTITGGDSVHGQLHITMEGLCCLTIPTPEGLECHVTSQWLDGCQQMISKALNMPSNKIDVHGRPPGGGFGLKISRSNLVSVCSALVSHKMNRPCRMGVPFTTTTSAIGKRASCLTNYEVAVDATGLIQSIKYRQYEDNGYMVDEMLTMLGVDVFNNCYTAGKWDYKVYDVITDNAKTTWCRAPGTLECISLAECVLERIAYELSLDPFDVRLTNIDSKYSDMIEVAKELKILAKYAERKAEVEKFNSENRWKVRGLRCSLARWEPYGYSILDVNMSICHTDGTVIITHGGVEMGQGINTKAAQICAYLLNISMDKIVVKRNNTIIAPNCFATGGSYGSQNTGLGVSRCCGTMLARLEPIRTTLGDPTWIELIVAAKNSNVDLQVHSYVGAEDVFPHLSNGGAVCEVELDVLTGECNILRVDILQEAGRSISPEIDIGQIEGAFMMGVGYWTCEDLKYNPTTGQLLSNSLWTYYAPQARDIPQDMRVTLKSGCYSEDLIFGAKCIGEPPICLAVVVNFAIRAAIVAGRAKVGIPASTWFDVEGPFTTEKICMNMGLNKEDFLFT